VKHQFVAQLHQHTFAYQQRNDLLAARAVDRERGQHVFEQGNLQPRRRKGLFDGLARAFLVGTHGHAAARKANLLALNFDLLAGSKLFEEKAEDRFSKLQLFPKSFFGDPGDQRIRFVKCFQLGQQPLRRVQGR